MKRNTKFLFVVALIGAISQYSWSQTFSSKKNQTVAENILNAAINSVPFNDVYSAGRVYFQANELLTTNSSLVLKKKGDEVSIVDKSQMEEGHSYVVLGDFTLDWNNPTSARLQFVVMPDNIMLGMRLVKNRDDWIVDDYVQFKY